MNPDDFPPEAFPTPCMHCGYDLHATPRLRRCPECGTPVYRGRDLVAYYARGQEPRHAPGRRMRKWLFLLPAAVVGSYHLFLAALFLYLRWLYENDIERMLATVDVVQPVFRGYILIFLLFCIPAATIAFLWYGWHVRARRRPAKAIRAAIDARYDRPRNDQAK